MASAHSRTFFMYFLPLPALGSIATAVPSGLTVGFHEDSAGCGGAGRPNEWIGPCPTGRRRSIQYRPKEPVTAAPPGPGELVGWFRAMFDSDQLLASVIAVFVASAACAVLVFARTQRAIARRAAYAALCACAMLALMSWLRFGRFHTVFLDAHPGDFGPNRPKVEAHQPLHFHEMFHYYVGSKYFRELGYLGLYDCTVLADQEIAREEGVAPHITNAYVRDLADVLNDKTHAAALEHCRSEVRPRFSDERWRSFKGDIRELQRLVPDDWWNEAVFDAGFNPPPSWTVVGASFSNVIPLRNGTLPTYLVATGLDMALLVVAFACVFKAFGRTTAVVAAVFFGATFITSYGWNAGALLAMSACDRIFPAGFAVGAAAPIAWRALRSPEHRRQLARFGGGFGATVAVLVVASCVLFGASSWSRSEERRV